MDADNVLETRLGTKAEFDPPFGRKVAGPAGNYLHDCRVGFAADAAAGRLAGDLAKGLDLLSHGAGNAGKGHIPAAAEKCRIEGRGMDEELNRRPGAGVPMPHVVRHWQDRLLTGERFADDAGEKARCREVRLSGPHADGREAEADAVKETAPRIVGKQEFANRLLGAIACQRSEEKLIADLVGEGGAENRDGGSED